jgi:hypothetical protein
MTPVRCAAVALALAACATDPPDPELTVTRTVVGDTAVVTTAGPKGSSRAGPTTPSVWPVDI